MALLRGEKTVLGACAQLRTTHLPRRWWGREEERRSVNARRVKPPQPSQKGKEGKTELCSLNVRRETNLDGAIEKYG